MCVILALQRAHSYMERKVTRGNGKLSLIAAVAPFFSQSFWLHVHGKLWKKKCVTENVACIDNYKGRRPHWRIHTWLRVAVYIKEKYPVSTRIVKYRLVIPLNALLFVLIAVYFILIKVRTAPAYGERMRNRSKKKRPTTKETVSLVAAGRQCVVRTTN